MNEQYVIFNTSHVRDAVIVACVLNNYFMFNTFKAVGCTVTSKEPEEVLGDLLPKVLLIAESARLAACLSRFYGTELALGPCEACELETMHQVNDHLCEDCRADEREAVRESGEAEEITEMQPYGYLNGDERSIGSNWRSGE